MEADHAGGFLKSIESAWRGFVMADNIRWGSSREDEVEAMEEQVETQHDLSGREPDYVLQAMTAAIDQIVDGNGGPNLYPLPGANTQLIDMLRQLTEVGAHYDHEPEEPGGVKHPDIQKIDVARRKIFKDNSFTFRAVETVALGTFQAAWFVWQQARDDYHYTLGSAQADLQLAAEQALEIYTDKWSADSPVRNAILYQQLQATVAAAMTTYQGVAAGAGPTLAGAAGAMLIAYATLISTGQAAEMAQITNDIAAGENFMEAVQSLRNA